MMCLCHALSSFSGISKRAKLFFLLSKIRTTVFLNLSCPFSSIKCLSSAVSGRTNCRGHLSSHAVLCNSISHLAWSEGDARRLNSNSNATKAHVRSRTPRFNPSGLHQSQTWGESISNWPPSRCSLRWHCAVHRSRLPAKWIWLNGHHAWALMTVLNRLPEPFWTPRWKNWSPLSKRWTLYTSPEISSHSSVIRTHNPRVSAGLSVVAEAKMS